MVLPKVSDKQLLEELCKDLHAVILEVEGMLNMPAGHRIPRNGGARARPSTR
jgi:hypothetical protein